ncbi:MarR family winged helix-turn-helix transcriptional regulator [Actinotalea sp. Marseille-Q4924]|uniref:MarR family winged helix-turn-helix transcriptional regulator n=1 Tax=Actinotalea sp. Marseille-Q4924 TaxID=2866571 RepID=UPI001CE45FDE|nr:MarR family winged helix-turn-helix transcriptional regulator [Actinotalea sp. Marseille-Q4924]
MKDRLVRDPAFGTLDAALLALRRFWSAPDAVADVPPGAGSAGAGPPPRHVESSTLLVAEALRSARAAGREATVADVAEALDVAPSTASRLVDRAIGAGVVVKAPSARNRRRVRLDLTDDGAALAGRALAFRAHRLGALLEGWSPADREHLARLLARFAAEVRAERLTAGTAHDDASGLV